MRLFVFSFLCIWANLLGTLHSNFSTTTGSPVVTSPANASSPRPAARKDWSRFAFKRSQPEAGVYRSYKRSFRKIALDSSNNTNNANNTAADSSNKKPFGDMFMFQEQEICCECAVRDDWKPRKRHFHHKRSSKRDGWDNEPHKNYNNWYNNERTNRHKDRKSWKKKYHNEDYNDNSWKGDHGYKKHKGWKKCRCHDRYSDEDDDWKQKRKGWRRCGCDERYHDRNNGHRRNCWQNHRNNEWKGDKSDKWKSDKWKSDKWKSDKRRNEKRFDGGWKAKGKFGKVRWGGSINLSTTPTPPIETTGSSIMTNTASCIPPGYFFSTSNPIQEPKGRSEQIFRIQPIKDSWRSKRFRWGKKWSKSSNNSTSTATPVKAA